MLDTNRYRRDVLKVLLDEGRPSMDDPFSLFALDPGMNDATAIRSQVDEVIAFWRKEQSSPRYKNLATALLKDRDALAAEVLDPRKRAANRDRVLAHRSAAAASKFAQLDQMLDTLDRRLGGIPASRLDRLREAARRAGISDDEFQVHLRGKPIIDDSDGTADAPPPIIRIQARALLAEYSSLNEDTPRRTYRTLFEFIGVEATTAVPTIEMAHERVASKNRQRRHDRLRTVVDELLALVTDLLISGRSSSYVAGLAADTADEIRPHIETALLLEDRLTAVEFERLLQISIAGGLDAETARRTVVLVARQLGAPVEMGTAVDYVVCASCGAANAASSDERRCNRCGLELYQECPGCRRQAARSSASCPWCSLDLAALREATAELESARASLREGFLADARWRAQSLVRWSGQLSDVQRLITEIDNIGKAVAEAWARLPKLITEGRFDDALVTVSNLESLARDTAGPDGSLPDAVREDVEARLLRIRQEVQAAVSRPPNEREVTVLRLADEYPNSADVLSALRSLPLASPSRVVSIVAADTVRLSWKASPSSGPVQYRVLRHVNAADESMNLSRPIGSTSATSIEDAGATAGTVVWYEVQAVRHGIQSGRVGTRPQLIAFEVARLAAVEHDGAVELRWTRHAGHESIWVERIDTTDSSVPLLRARAGDSGWIDTAVVSDHRYSYRVFVEYTASGHRIATSGRTVSATAFVVPDPPTVEIVGHGPLQLRVAGADRSSAVIIRCDHAPELAVGTVLDRRRLPQLGRLLDPASDGTISDRPDGRTAWYLPVKLFGGQAITGQAVLHPGLGEVRDVTATADGDELIVRWVWPTGCTEAIIAWRFGRDPQSLDDTDAMTTKITNTGYEISGGCRIRKLEDGVVGVLVRPARRVDGQLVPVPGDPEASRVRYTWRSMQTISYAVRRLGRRKKELSVEITRDVPGRPSLAVVAYPAAPSNANSRGQVLGSLDPRNSSTVVSLVGVELPSLVSLVLTPEPDLRLTVEDPRPEERTIE